MDIRKVKKLIELLEESGIDELEITEGEESVRICRHRFAAALPAAMAPAMRHEGMPKAWARVTKSGKPTPLSGPAPARRPKKFFCVLRIDR